MAQLIIANGELKKCILSQDETEVVIPSNVTSIGGKAFEGCTSLATIDIPSSVKCIGDFAFWGYTSLANIDIPSSVESIGDCAFQNCTSLATIVIPSSVKCIGDWAFESCTSLASISIPAHIDNIADLGLHDGCIVTRRALSFLPRIEDSLQTVGPTFSLAEAGFVKHMLLIINRLKSAYFILPEDILIKILSLSQHTYIPTKTMAVGAQALEHSDAEQQQITAYNNHNAIWECVGAQLLGD